MRWIVVLVTLSGGAVHAQEISGTWQGTLQAGKELRVVFIIANVIDRVQKPSEN